MSVTPVFLKIKKSGRKQASVHFVQTSHNLLSGIIPQAGYGGKGVVKFSSGAGVSVDNLFREVSGIGGW
jgi:hypothetical protein